MPATHSAPDAILVVEDHQLSAALLMGLLRGAFPARALHLAGTASLGYSEDPTAARLAPLPAHHRHDQRPGAHSRCAANDVETAQ